MDRATGQPVELTRTEELLLRAQRRLGVGGLVAAISGVSIGLSVAVTAALLATSDGYGDPGAWIPPLATAVAVPALVAPPASLFSARLTSRLDDANRRLGIAATTDPLTGVLNRRGFFGALAALADGLPGTGTVGVVGMVDLDDFKDLNDRHGHDAGDRALIALAGHLRSRLGTGAVIGRLGGDEFAFVVPAPAPPAVEECGDRWQLAIEPGIHFSATVGTTGMMADESVDLALSRADAGLYRSKSPSRLRPPTGARRS